MFESVRHIHFMRGIFVTDIVWKFRMSGNSIVLVIDLDQFFSDLDVDLFSTILVGTGVTVLCNDNMEVNIDRPVIESFCHFIGDIGKFMQILSLFFLKDLVPAAFTLLERRPVELCKWFRNSFFQVFKSVEILVSEFRDYRCGDFAYRTFHRSLLFRLFHHGRHDGGHIVLSQGFVIVIQDNIAFLWMVDHASLQIIANSTDRYPLKKLVYMDVAFQPAILLHIETGFHVGILAEGKRCNKKIDGMTSPVVLSTKAIVGPDQSTSTATLGLCTR